MQKIRWGIMATGGIAHSLATALQEVEQAQITAVASRTQEKADAFGDQYNIPNRHGSYEALAADPEVDVIYIATPHSHHYDNMKLCLNAGKHVLCEKAFTLDAQQAAECIALAREKKLFLMEAMWMRFFPAISQIRSWLQEGLLGDIRLVQADFCINLPYDPKHRLYNPELGGGALLDLGIYPLSFTTMVLGMPQKTVSHTHLSPTGVDGVDTMMLIYDSGATASLSCSMQINRPKEAYIIGSKGYLKVHDIFFRPDTVTLHLDGDEPVIYEFPFQGNGYPHEVQEVHDCLQAGKLESDIMSLDESLALMKLMDELRAAWGVRYPHEMA
ncbi:MAG: Gfo/Idh/MocA family oxidoreductase [Anaerolineales bacterium]|nr:Gfo/Idh/MocA family oxidoreductase [Anaerolineales bacterium]